VVKGRNVKRFPSRSGSPRQPRRTETTEPGRRPFARSRGPSPTGRSPSSPTQEGRRVHGAGARHPRYRALDASYMR